MFSIYGFYTNTINYPYNSINFIILSNLEVSVYVEL